MSWMLLAAEHEPQRPRTARPVHPRPGGSQPADLSAQPERDHINAIFGLPETFLGDAKILAGFLSGTRRTIKLIEFKFLRLWAKLNDQLALPAGHT
jgi:hypothetical protein